MSSSLRKAIVGGAAVVIGLSGLAACGSDSDSGGGDGGGGSSSAKITAACKLDSPPTSVWADVGWSGESPGQRRNRGTG